MNSIECSGDGACPWCALNAPPSEWSTIRKYFTNMVKISYEWENDYGWRVVHSFLQMETTRQQIIELQKRFAKEIS